MTNWVFGSADSTARRKQATWLVAAWLALVLLLLTRHVFWRDEVRALSLALQGDNLVAMLRGVHGEGHPAVWYLLLRGLHALMPTPAVLPGLSVAVALAAAALLAYRSPFGWPLIALLLLGRPALYEYSVMARNYGISMLLMFVFATLYRRHRDRGIWLGIVLALLANCNAHSALLAAAFCLFWLIDLTSDKATRPPAALRNFWLNAAIVGLGVLLCAATIYPPFNDAAQLDHSGGIPLAALAKALFLPASSFENLFDYKPLSALLAPMSHWHSPFDMLRHALLSVLLFGSALGLVRRPAALVAAWVSLLGFSVFFAIIYPGSYRHEALWLAFLVTLYWIVGRDGPPPRASPALQKIRDLGLLLFCALLILQVLVGAGWITHLALGSAPESRSRDLAQLVARDPGLKDAIIIADPDFLLEPLAYYLPNRTYLVRERRFGNTVIFTRKALQSLTLDDLLREARRLRDTTGQPVLILLSDRLDPAAPARTIEEHYGWKFSTTPEQVKAFIAATRRIESFAEACCSDESFDVYVLDR